MTVKKLLIVFILCLTGCSSFGGAKGTPFNGLNDVRPNTAQVYIYRPSSFTMSFAIPTLTIDGVTAESIRNGSYTLYELTPGTHQFSLSNNGNWVAGNIEFELTTESNERYFYRLSTELGDIAAYGQFATVGMGSYLHQVSESFALQEMSQLKFTGVWP